MAFQQDPGQYLLLPLSLNDEYQPVQTPQALKSGFLKLFAALKKDKTKDPKQQRQHHLETTNETTNESQNHPQSIPSQPQFQGPIPGNHGVFDLNYDDDSSTITDQSMGLKMVDRTTPPLNEQDMLVSEDPLNLNTNENQHQSNPAVSTVTYQPSIAQALSTGDLSKINEYDLKINDPEYDNNYQNYNNENDPQNFSLLLLLPLEILHRIIELVYFDNHTLLILSNVENFSKTMPLLLRTFNALLLRFLYKYAIFNRPHAFDKFLHNILKQTDIGLFVEFMDFQQFTSVGLGRTGRMNMEIQMVTSATILQALMLTPNLLEFLASENIEDDMNSDVLTWLFCNLPKIQSLDFCGASSQNFALAFQQLQIYNPGESSLNHILNLSFHDCSNLSVESYSKIFPYLHSLRRLDLNHTQVTSVLLNQQFSVEAKLTHLSLSRCSKLTTKDLIQFLTEHPATTSGRLEWLALQTDLNVVSPLSDIYLLYTLRHLKSPKLRLLNLGGLPVDKRHLEEIKRRFPKLELLHILHAKVSLEDINDYVKDNKQLKFLDLTSCKKLTRWNISNFLKTNFDLSICAIEFDYKILMELTGGEYLKVIAPLKLFLDPVTAPQIWKFYDNQGRRLWLYKIEPLDPYYKLVINSLNNSRPLPRPASVLNMTYYDLETGKKITQKYQKPDFLKYALRKISCLIGYHRIQDAKKKSYIEGTDNVDDVWPHEFSQRGIYNYYSLNVK